MRRRLLMTGLAGLPLGAPALRAQAGWQPTRPIQCIVGFAPGGGADLIARAIIEATQPLVPQPLVVVNRPGAGGTIAAQQVAGMPGDDRMYPSAYAHPSAGRLTFSKKWTSSWFAPGWSGLTRSSAL